MNPANHREERSVAHSIVTGAAVILLIVGVCGDAIMAAFHWLKHKA